MKFCSLAGARIPLQQLYKHVYPLEDNNDEINSKAQLLCDCAHLEAIGYVRAIRDDVLVGEIAPSPSAK